MGRGKGGFGGGIFGMGGGGGAVGQGQGRGGVGLKLTQASPKAQQGGAVRLTAGAGTGRSVYIPINNDDEHLGPSAGGPRASMTAPAPKMTADDWKAKLRREGLPKKEPQQPKPIRLIPAIKQEESATAAEATEPSQTLSSSRQEGCDFQQGPPPPVRAADVRRAQLREKGFGTALEKPKKPAAPTEPNAEPQSPSCSFQAGNLRIVLTKDGK
uniref:Uncharacterized protein n=1 Tax=Chromera velia CCMP2878 TaxID=1169474 RepID=A0A0G4HFC3_9ALVE|eukprot:Cvel_6634.t1-p1 / transcript=Cvel_6634.t1 / gene=Cvel_6634 / organism=Chromera_velia_CCMP2878 / gene_product=hypothetical protein / transcript_product=hypothetical protein / location=Cvel_scaffold328:94970-95605(+) / protein_length=212 / sequence_SO=supercontig / SO=protein_coding / is_pseudo=false